MSARGPAGIRSDPLDHVDARGLVLASGARHDLDVLVITGSLLRLEILGRDGTSLREAWAQGPATYLGLGVHRFPTLFVIAGAGSPALLINVLVGIELHVDRLAALLAEADRRGATAVEVAEAAQRAWGEQLTARANQTLYPKARSYYTGDEIPGKPRGFMLDAGGLRNYRATLVECAAGGYPGWECT